MSSKQRPFLTGALTVVLATGAATGVRYLLNPAYGSRAPLLFHVLAVAVTAQIAGLTAGLSVTLLTVLLIHHAAPASDAYMTPVLSIFGAVGVTMSVLGGLRKRERDEIRRVRTNLETAQQIANIGSWQSEAEGPLWWSDQTYRIFGVTPGAALRTEQFFDRVHPEDVAGVREAVRRALETRQDYDIEHRIVRLADGAVRHVHQRAKVVSGDKVRMIGSVQDVTEARNTMKSLERIGGTMRLALDSTGSGAWEWNLETGELIWTDTYYRLLGINRAVKPTLELFYSKLHRDDARRVKAENDSLLQGRSSEFRTEFRVHTSDGIRWLERRGRIVSSPEGKPIQMVGITVDITERKILRGLLPTCAQCRKVEDEHHRWQTLERYVTEHSEARFSHGLCPDCLKEALAAEGLTDISP